MYTIEDFFENGNYKESSKLEKTCAYPNGGLFEGSLVISSYNQCDERNKFIAKMLTIKIYNSMIVSVHYNINGTITISSDNGGTAFGKYRLKKNKLIVHQDGFFTSIGKNVLVKTIIKKKIDNKKVQYSGKSYYKENEKDDWIYYRYFRFN